MHPHHAAFVLAALTTVVSSPALAVTTGPDAQATTVAPTAAKAADPIVCRSITVAGTRMPQRVCSTKSDWERRSDDASQALRDGQEDNMRRPLQLPDEKE